MFINMLTKKILHKRIQFIVIYKKIAQRSSNIQIPHFSGVHERRNPRTLMNIVPRRQKEMLSQHVRVLLFKKIQLDF